MQPSAAPPPTSIAQHLLCQYMTAQAEAAVQVGKMAFLHGAQALWQRQPYV